MWPRIFVILAELNRTRYDFLSCPVSCGLYHDLTLELATAHGPVFHEAASIC